MWRYTVTGFGEFPVVMLSCAHAWPSDIIQAQAMTTPGSSFRVRHVELCAALAPDRDAWREIGWLITTSLYEP